VTGRGRTSLAAATLVAALVLPAGGALAQGSGTPVLPGQGPSNALTPFAPQAPVPAQPAPTPTPAPTTSTTGGGLNGTDGVAIGIGAMLVLGGISFFIWRDARKRAPVRQHAAAAAGGGPGPRQRPQKTRKLSPAERKRRKRGRAR
jgi:hypothetical protein